VDYLKSSRPHVLFSGENALKHALWYDIRGAVCRDERLLFDFKPPIQKAIQYSKANQTAMPVSNLNVEGGGNHAKIYVTKQGLIFSSQNNGNSPLFEFAILYKRRTEGKLETFVEDTLENCVHHLYKRRRLNGKNFH
jgi:hypothetical protein